MRGRKLLSIFALFVLVIGIAACDSGGGNNNGGGPTPPPPTQPPPNNACNAPTLNTPYLTDDMEEFFVFTSSTSDLSVRVFSDGGTVFMLADDGMSIFGFRGLPINDGGNCGMISASVDFNSDGTFDETATNFMSACARLNDGANITLIDGPSSVMASMAFEDQLLELFNEVLFFNVLGPVSCTSVEDVDPGSTFGSLLAQLQAQ